MARHEGLPRPPLALIISDEEWASRSLDTTLTPQGYAVVRAHTGREGVDGAATARPDVIFIDAVLPDGDGVSVCNELRRGGRISLMTPIFLIRSGILTRKYRIQAYEAGAWGVIGFPMDGEELTTQLEAFVSAKMSADRALGRGMVDERTGAYNWEGLVRRLEEAASQAQRYHRPLACVVVSLRPRGFEGDGATADEMTLRELVELLRLRIRGSDLVGRLGRGDLVVVAPETDPGGATGLEARINASVTAHFQGDSAPRLQLGSYAVEDFYEAAVDPLEMVVRASAVVHGN